MGPFSKILFPVDFSERCTATAPAVAAYARHWDARVSLLYSFELPREIQDAVESQALRETAEDLQRRMRQRLDSYLTGILPAETERIAVSGKPASAIVQFARDAGAGLIMMPTHGHSRYRQLLLGSVTSAVLHDAECPVWTSAHAEALPPSTECRSVVCAVDLGRNTVPALRQAQLVAASWNAALHVIHAVSGVDERLESAVTQRARAFLILSAQEEYPKLAKEAGVDAPLEILEERSLGACIAVGCHRQNADLLVIGRGSIQGTLGRLRTSAYEIIRSAPCPVLSI